MSDSDYSLEYLTDQNRECLLIYLTGEGMDSDLAPFFSPDYDLCLLKVRDWDRQLTPWKAKGPAKEREFGGEGPLLYQKLEEEILPQIRIRRPGCQRLYLVGYSLAGLFALWALYQNGSLSGAVCASGSLWYPGWDRYLIENSMPSDKRVYLSLGRKEAKNNNPVMKCVGERFQMQEEALKRDGASVLFEWQEGGHFTGVAERIRKGMNWISLR